MVFKDNRKLRHALPRIRGKPRKRGKDNFEAGTGIKILNL
jgi:hypothetical protein